MASQASTASLRGQLPQHNITSNASTASLRRPSPPFHMRITVRHTSRPSGDKPILSDQDHLEVISLFPSHITDLTSLREQIFLALQTTLEGSHRRNGQSLYFPKEEGRGSLGRRHSGFGLPDERPTPSWTGNGNIATQVTSVCVLWEVDAKGRETYTYAHKGNVRALVGMLTERTGCSDVLVVEIEE